MDIIRCIAIDDEPLPLELLQDYIGRIPFLHMTGAYSNPFEALPVVTAGKVDLAFLDIQMKEINGLQFSQLIRNKCKIVFTTAYPQFALEGFEADAVDYLVKPVSFERFLRSVNKAREAMPAGTGITATATISQTDAETLFVKSGPKIVQIAVNEILYIEGLREYVAIYTPKGKIIALQTFKKIQETLDRRKFIRVHKSFVVAFDKINSVEKGQLFVGSKAIPIGEVYKEYLFDAIKKKNML